MDTEKRHFQDCPKDYEAAVKALRNGNIAKVKEIILRFEETAKQTSGECSIQANGVARWLQDNLDYMRWNRLTKLRR